MIFEKLKASVVSHLSYFIGSGAEAFVVDPQRDPTPYLELAKQNEVNIKYIFETHRNEDYVIGSIELADQTGASIHHGPWPDFKYGNKLDGGEKFKVGNLEVTTLHTPGHTPGCMSYVVTDKETGDDSVLVCTGDTLFIGEAGRTDFGGPENREKWSTWLYESIHEKLLPLGDHVIVCPAHGSGSVCGTKIANREYSTLGSERLMNPLLQLNREEFIQLKTEEHHEYATYFSKMEKYNLEGAPPVCCSKTLEAFTVKRFKEYMDRGAVVVDFRPPPAYGAGHIKGAYSLPVSRVMMGGWVLPYDKPLVLVVSDQNDLEYVSKALISIGYDNVVGYLRGTIVSWYLAANNVEQLDLMTVHDLKKSLDEDTEWTVVDVRSVEEYEDGHIDGSINIYVGKIPQHLEMIPKDKPIAVICKSGTRSSFGSSLLMHHGVTNVHNILGGMTAWKKAGYSMK